MAHISPHEQTAKGAAAGTERRAADGSGDGNQNTQEGKQCEVEAIEAVPLHIGTATGPAALTETALAWPSP